MNALTKRFLKYRKTVKVPKPEPVPVHYKIEGFLTKQETVLQRMGRLTEAIAREEVLSQENQEFFYAHRRLKNGMGQFRIGPRERVGLMREDRSFRRMMAQTKGLISGGGCCPR